jgi:predicted ATPase with chaperone activity
MLMVGPPGSGKTMLAKRMSTTLPDLTPEESIETTRIYSAVGRLQPGQPLLAVRPFRSPHHTISNAGLVGGGSTPSPGETRRNCRLDAARDDLLRSSVTELGLSARAHDKVLRVARTIADLDGCPTILLEHLNEAVNYRLLDRNLWK